MASISTGPNGHRTIQFIGADGKRRSVRLGKMSMRQTESIKLRVEALEDRCLLSVYDVTGIADGLGSVTPVGPGKFDASTLRAAVIAADQSGNRTANTIILPARTYALTLAGADVLDSTSGQLTISSDSTLTIEGAGASNTVIDASQSIGEQQRLVRSLLDEMYGFPATPAAPETIDAAPVGADEPAEESAA